MFTSKSLFVLLGSLILAIGCSKGGPESILTSQQTRSSNATSLPGDDDGGGGGTAGGRYTVWGNVYRRVVTGIPPSYSWTDSWPHPVRVQIHQIDIFRPDGSLAYTESFYLSIQEANQWGQVFMYYVTVPELGEENISGYTIRAYAEVRNTTGGMDDGIYEGTAIINSDRVDLYTFRSPFPP